MITNPNDKVLDRALAQEFKDDADKDAPNGHAFVKVQKFRGPDHDAQIDRMVHTVSTRLTEVDAVLMEKQSDGRYTPTRYPTFAKLMESRAVRARISERVSAGELKDLNTRLREHVVGGMPSRTSQKRRKLVESSFDMGLYPDEVTTGYGTHNPSVFPIQDTILPGINSPYAKQQMFMDYLDMHRKSWEAATRNPLGKRIVDLITQFVLGRGLTCTVADSAHQVVWDEHWQRNRMRWRTRMVLRELLIYGEIFLRYFDSKDGLLVRSLDPSTIWDIVTDPDDIESVAYYHQQYTLLNTSPVPGNTIPATLIIRQIPGSQIDHFKINCTSSEKRGRSQLFTILGWLLRLKEFTNDRIILNKMRAMFALDVKVTGGDPTDMSTVEERFSTPPPAGSVLIHNDAVEMEFLNANTGSADAKTDLDMLLKIIALGSGVSEQFLGVAQDTTRAGALIQTEPDVKNFETFQEIVEDIHLSAYERLRVKHRLPRTHARFEVTFPALAQEDRSKKLKDIAFAEAMDYFSKARAATMAAKEFSVSTYDYEHERQEIATERAKAPMMAKGMEQMPKITQAEGPGDGLLDSGDGQPGPKPDPMNDKTPGVTQMSGEMGFSARNLSGRGTADTQATLNRADFTRGGEAERIEGRKSSGTPVRASADGPPQRKRNVWNDLARAKALETRRRKRENKG